MIDTLKDKLKNNAQNKIYDKENKETIIKFRDTIIEDLTSILADAQAVSQAADRVLNDTVHSDEFVINKLKGEMEYLTSCIDSLTQMNEKSPKKFRLLDIYKAYKRIMKSHRSIRNIKEYIHRIKEDNMMYILNKNSQQP